ncbi:MAG: hypothetical protein ACK41T_02720 [Pseudobdellovibrio sp.]
MKNILLTASIMLTVQLSQADIIKCSFTEPFVSSTYSMTQSTLTYTDNEGTTQVIKNVSFQIKSAGHFELVNKQGKVLQILTIEEGSDGMSDIIFPYSAKDNNSITHKGFGGCTSNYLKAVNPNQN